MSDLTQVQKQREIDARAAALNRDDQTRAYMTTAGNGSQLQAGTALIARLIAPVTAILEEDAAPKRTRSNAPCTLTKGHDLQAVATIALITTLDEQLMHQGFTSRARIASRIGAYVHDDMMFTSLREAHRGLYEVIKRRLSIEGPNFVDRANRLQVKRGKIDWEPWTRRQKMLVGLWGLTALKKAGVVEVVGNEQQLTPDLLGKLNELNAWLRSRMVMSWPMVIPPRPWENLNHGGYIDYDTGMILGRTNLKKVKKFQDESGIPNVLESINTIQSTAWRVNPLTLGVLSETVNTTANPGYLPRTGDIPEPPPFTGEEKSKEHRDYRDRVRGIVNQNKELNHARAQASTRVQAAEDLSKYPSIYFVHRMDFRGRLYPSGVGFNPQAEDYSKGLIQFAEPEPVDTEEARQWLGVHTANTFGEDKLSLSDRVQWAEDHAPQMRRALTDPQADDWWQQADKPVSFLAAAADWVGLLEHGLGYPSRVPIAMDGTCNGLQHLSAIVRDQDAAPSVNLVPADLPSDIYRDVADAVISHMLRETDPTLKPWADGWLGLGINRNTTKRTVMVVPYGGTMSSCRSYLREWYEQNTAQPWGNRADFVEPLTYLANTVWAAIAARIPKARQVMDWLQEVVAAVTADGQPMIWQTPDNWTVYQEYNARYKDRVALKCMGGKQLMKFVKVDDRVLDSRKARNSFAPNFTHSLDACHLRMTVNTCKQQGVRSFAMIHDSFGTHARHAPTMARVLREQFVTMYEEHDPLQDLVEAYGELGLPEAPERGQLDLHAVVQSKYFFS